jgi:hypothetical protein
MDMVFGSPTNQRFEVHYKQVFRQSSHPRELPKLSQLRAEKIPAARARQPSFAIPREFHTSDFDQLFNKFPRKTLRFTYLLPKPLNFSSAARSGVFNHNGASSHALHLFVFANPMDSIAIIHV